MADAGAAINESAASWAIRLDAGPLREDEQLALQAWLESNPRHHGALIRARAHWADLERLGALAGAQEAESDLEDLERAERRKFLAAGLAITVAGGLGATLFVLRRRGERFETQVGEMRRLALADGTTLVLNTASQVVVRYESERRTVNLIRGEALFEVAEDLDRVFVVHVSDVHIRAVGTVFATRLRGDEVEIVVSEGRVELARVLSYGVAPGVQRVLAGEEAFILPAKRPEVRKVSPEALDRRLAWLEGQVAFNGETLRQAVAEMNRHSRRKIIVDDPELEGLPVVGRFRAADAEGFCRSAARSLGATVADDGDTIHMRTPRKS